MSPQQGIGGRHRRRRERAAVVTAVPIVLAMAWGSATAQAAPQDFVTAPDTAQSGTTDTTPVAPPPAPTQERQFLPGYQASPRVQETEWRSYDDYRSGNQQSSYQTTYYEETPAPQTPAPQAAPTEAPPAFQATPPQSGPDQHHDERQPRRADHRSQRQQRPVGLTECDAAPREAAERDPRSCRFHRHPGARHPDRRPRQSGHPIRYRTEQCHEECLNDGQRQPRHRSDVLPHPRQQRHEERRAGDEAVAGPRTRPSPAHSQQQHCKCYRSEKPQIDGRECGIQHQPG